MAEPPLPTDSEKFSTSDKISQERKNKGDITSFPGIYSLMTESDSETFSTSDKISRERKIEGDITSFPGISPFMTESDSETFSTSDKISLKEEIKGDTTLFHHKSHPSHSKNVTQSSKHVQWREKPSSKFFPSGYHKLEELDLSNQHLSLSEMSSKLAGCRNVRKLDLSGCGLTELPELDDLDKLEELNLSNNPLRMSYWGVHKLSSLRKLDLSGCGLEAPINVRYPGALEELNLSNNPLCVSYWKAYQFVSHWKMKYDYDPFEHYWEMLWPRSLRKLDLSGCGLTRVPVLIYCDKLEELNMSNNLLKYPLESHYVTQSLCLLRKLDLSGCGLTEVPELDNLDKLEELNLSNNHFDHQDLLQKFKSRKSSHISDLKPLEHIASFFTKSPNLRRIIFEDGAYIYSQLQGQKGLNKWIWQETDGNIVKENWLDEFSRLAKSESGKLTIETYHLMLKSLNVVRSLVGDNVESCLDRASTFSQCCLEILNYLPAINIKGSLNSYSKECLIDLQSGVSFLKNWSSGSDDDKNTFQLKKVMAIYHITGKNASEAFSKMSDTADGGIFATMLKIVSEVLHNLTKPETVVIRCLQFLQELHDLPLIKRIFSSLIITDKSMTSSTFLNVLSVHKMNKILYEFVRMFVKPPPTVEEWPATIQLDEQVYNPLIGEQFLKEKNIVGTYHWRAEFSQMESDIDKIIGTDKNVGGQNTDVVEYNDSIIESNPGTSVNSITVKAEGGCFGIPVASAFLLFPPQAVEDEIILECSRVKHKDSEVKPRDAVSQILKIEPEGVAFKKPVTVLLSHSAYEDEVFKNFYELIVERFRPTKDSTDLFPTGWLELNTREISSSEDLPKGIRNAEIMEDYLPFAKATIQETCTLVATTRIRSDQVLIPTRKSYTFCKHYGENTELKITFPAGVTDSMLSLKIQLLPAEVVLNKDMRLNENLVCGPVIRVSGQSVPFLNPVDVELTYSHEDFSNISEEVLPVESKIKFTTKYGLLLRSKKVEESKKWENLNEFNDVNVERLRKDQLQFSFSVKHFCDILPVVKTNDESDIHSSEVAPVVNVENQARHLAFVLAVHKIDDIQNTLHSVLTPKLEKRSVETKWKVDAIRFMDSLTSGEPIFFCVPLSESSIDYHLHMIDYTLRFDPDTESELPNNTDKNVDLRGKFMRFLKDNECNNGTNHSTQGDCRAKAPIHVSETISVQATTEQHKSTLDSRFTRELNQESPLRNRHISEVIKVMFDHCELFQRSVEITAQKKLEIEAVKKDPKAGKMTKVVDVAGPAATVLFSLACGITVATGFATFGIASFCTAAVAGGTLIVKSVDKHKKQANAKRFVQKLDEAAKRERAHVSSYLNCLVKDIAKELCRIFEYQLFHLKSEKQVTLLAESAVDLMLDLKKDDVFDRNTLLKNVLLNGEAKKRELLTCNDEKWFAPDVFRKPGLRRVIIGTNSTECVYQVKPDGTCDTKKYGYRGQFLEIMEYGGENEEATSDAMTNPVDDENSKFRLCEKFQDCCSSGEYFVESDIDSKYTKPCQEAFIYRPLHLLVQCREVLYSFSDTLQENRSFADFLKTKIGIQDNEMLLPVYRQHVPGKVLDCSQASKILNKANLTGSDFSYSNFGDSFLLGCDFTKCVMLFAKLTGAKMSGSTFLDTFISHSDLREVKADGCSWTTTSVLHSRVDNADLSHAVPSVGDNHWDGTNLWDAIISRPVEPLNLNGANHLREIPKGQMSYV